MNITVKQKSPSIEFALTCLKGITNDINVTIEVDSTLNLKEEGYRIEVSSHGVNLTGKDNTGAMYGIMDLAEQIKADNLHSVSQEPYLEKRGFKFNIPLDVRTPSYSDGADCARQNYVNMWDWDFWTRVIDQMAFSRMNTLSLWNEHPFPSMVRVNDYPQVALEDVMKPGMGFYHSLMGHNLHDEEIHQHHVIVKKITMDEKIAFWQKVMEYAHDRGVKVYICTWNIFVYGTEHTDYGIDDDQKNPVTLDYFKKSVEAMVKTYPLLAGIGVTAGENMNGKFTGKDSNEAWLRKTYGQGIIDGLAGQPDRDFTFIHRAHMMSLTEIYDTFSDFNHKMDLSFKYSMAHMYGAVKPAFGFDYSDHDMPDKEGFFNSMPKGEKTWLTVRDDDFYQYRHGHPDFARAYILAMPREKVRGMYMGPDGYIMGKEYIAQDGKIRLFTEKMQFNVAVWGRLSYNPELTDDDMFTLFQSQYEGADRAFYEAFKAASNVIPELNRVHWHNLDFQWYPEGNVSAERGRYLFFHSIRDFSVSSSAPGSDHVGIGDYCEALAKGKNIKGILPPEAADNILKSARTALAYVEKTPAMKGESACLLNDIHALALLGFFYEKKVRGGVEYGLYKKIGDKKHQKTAVELAQQSYDCFVNYAQKWSTLYKPQFLTRIQYPVDMIAFCEFAKNDILIVEGEE
jgi:peroxiredoxin family protein